MPWNTRIIKITFLDMCGRFTLRRLPDDLAQKYGVVFKGKEFRPGFNIAPGGEILALPDDDKREIIWMHWGLTPSWLKQKSGALINVRLESVKDKPIFKKYLNGNRCLIPADGFYEWKNEGGKKQPYYFKFEDDRVFSFAGVWEESDNIIRTAILTVPPNDMVGKIHNRMPCILNKEQEDEWLKGAGNKNFVDLLAPRELGGMVCHKVGLGVNLPGSEGPELIEKL